MNGDGGEGGVRSWSDSPGQGKQNARKCKIFGQTHDNQNTVKGKIQSKTYTVKCKIQGNLTKVKMH